MNNLCIKSSITRFYRQDISQQIGLMKYLKGSTGVILRASTAENCCQKLPFSTEPWTLFNACRLI